MAPVRVKTRLSLCRSSSDNLPLETPTGLPGCQRRHPAPGRRFRCLRRRDGKSWHPLPLLQVRIHFPSPIDAISPLNLFLQCLPHLCAQPRFGLAHWQGLWSCPHPRRCPERCKPSSLESLTCGRPELNNLACVDPAHCRLLGSPRIDDHWSPGRWLRHRTWWFGMVQAAVEVPRQLV